MKWREIFSQYQRALPRNASPRERGEAARRASAAYRGHTRSNPSSADMTRLLVIGAAVYLGMQLLKQQQPQTPTQQTYKPPVPGI